MELKTYPSPVVDTWIVGTVDGYLQKLQSAKAPPAQVPEPFLGEVLSSPNPVLSSLRDLFPGIAKVPTIRDVFGGGVPYTGLAAAL